jgi:ribosomal protein L29
LILQTSPKSLTPQTKLILMSCKLNWAMKCKHYSILFKSKEEIEEEINNIKEKLFHYDLLNAEVFSQQISQIEDRKQVLEIKKALGNCKKYLQP